jgi:hypothetical protein
MKAKIRELSTTKVPKEADGQASPMKEISKPAAAKLS